MVEFWDEKELELQAVKMMEQERLQLNDSQVPVDELDVAFYVPDYEMSEPAPSSKTEFNLSIS